MRWPFPAVDADPWDDAFVDFVRAKDASAFAAREDRNIILAGGGTLTWNAAIPVLTWTEDFLLLSPSTGFFTRLTAASLAPADGQVVRAEIVRAPGSNRNVAAEVAAIALNTDNSMFLGIRVGTNFLFRNGALIKTGTTIAAEDLFSGAGGAAVALPFVVKPTVTVTESPYAAVIRESVRADTVANGGGPITIELPTAIGNAGFPIKVVKTIDDLVAVVLDPFLAQTINGQPNFVLNTNKEDVYVESDGANWFIF